jgi:hypothetical protein
MHLLLDLVAHGFPSWLMTQDTLPGTYFSPVSPRRYSTFEFAFQDS